MKYKWLMFDADGTLFDYDRAEAEALRNSFTQMNIDFRQSYLELYDSLNKKLWRMFEKNEIEVERLKIQRFEETINELDFEIDAEIMSKKYLFNLSQCSFLLDGAESVPARLENQVNMMLITNGLKDVQRPRLENSSIKRFFPIIIISEEVGSAKPDSKIFDAAFNTMGNPAKSEVIIIGDSLTSDIKGGTDYGIDTCWFNHRNQTNDAHIHPTYEIKKLNELIEIVS